MTIGAGTTSYTVGSVMERLYVTYLTPPDEQDARARLPLGILEDQEVFILGSFEVPEDEQLLRQGVLIEADQELMRVVSYDTVTFEVTVKRGEYGTIPKAYPDGQAVVLNPPYPRAAVFEAVADNIILLYPKLFTTGAELLSPVAERVYSLPDPLAVTVLSTQPGDFASTVDIHSEIVDFHPLAGGRALLTNAYTGAVWLRYRRRMMKPTGEDDTLDALGVDERWVNIIMAGAAADLMVGRDISAAHTQWVKSVLEAENIPVGTRVSVAGGLRQYRNLLLDDAMTEMKGEYKPKVRMRQAHRSIT